MKREEVIKKIFLALGTLIVLSSLFILVFRKNFEKPAPEVKPVEPTYISALKNISPLAVGVYVYDTSENLTLYTKNETKVLPMASITKVMTARIALEVLGSDAIVQIPEEALLSDGDAGLVVGEEWTVPDLVEFMLTTSSNDAAEALAISYGRDRFIAVMNTRAQELGLLGMHFENPTGLDEVERGVTGGVGSPQEVGKLLWTSYAKFPSVFESTRDAEYTVASENGVSHNARNTNKVTGEIPGLLASKTGFTDAAGGNLGFVINVGLNHPVIVVIMGSSVDGRFFDALEIVGALMKDSAKDL